MQSSNQNVNLLWEIDANGRVSLFGDDINDPTVGNTVEWLRWCNSQKVMELSFRDRLRIINLIRIEARHSGYQPDLSTDNIYRYRQNELRLSFEARKQKIQEYYQHQDAVLTSLRQECARIDREAAIRQQQDQEMAKRLHERECARIDREAAIRQQQEILDAISRNKRDWEMAKRLQEQEKQQSTNQWKVVSRKKK
jgi:hypothetical protein